MRARSSARRAASMREETAPPASVRRPKAPVSATAVDRLLHDPMRLGIASALAAGGELSFTALKTALEATDGNLSVHARKLEEAGYITCTKFFEGRTPKTEFKITETGRKTLEKYLAHMEALIRRVREG